MNIMVQQVELITRYCIISKKTEKIFMDLLGLGILNSYHLYKMQTQEASHDVMTKFQFRIGLARSILVQNLQDNLPGYIVRIGRPSSELTPAQLVERHFPSLILSNENKQDDVSFLVIQTRKHRGKHESRYECTTYGVGLCIDLCFRIYHTSLNF